MSRSVKTERYSTRLSSAESTHLEKLSNREGKSSSEYLRELVRQDMKKRNREVRQQEANRRELQLAMASHKLIEKMAIKLEAIECDFLEENMSKSKNFAMKYYDV